jgi:hypothetical protein
LLQARLESRYQSIYEATLGLILLGTTDMEKHSALLQVHHEEQIPLDADHSTMCKFEEDSDDTFEKVYKTIQRMRSDTWSKKTTQASKSP